MVNTNTDKNNKFPSWRAALLIIFFILLGALIGTATVNTLALKQQKETHTLK